MNDGQRTLELRVGFFVVVGVAIIAFMAVQFGRLGEGIRDVYELTVEFSNASGLLKDSNVLFNGAKIGWVATEPTIVNDPEVLEQATGVTVKLKVYAYVEIPRESRFMVSSSGLLGDRFVDVLPPSEVSGEVIAPGSTVAGSRQPSIDDLTREGTDLIGDLRETVGTINTVVNRVDDEVLSGGNIDDLDAMLDSLRRSSGNIETTSEEIAAAGARIDGILDSVNGAVERANETMNSAKLAGADLELAMSEARTALAGIRQLVERARDGDGVVGRLLADEALAENLEALIANLRQHGVLFYRDSRDGGAASGEARPAGSRAGGPGRNPVRR